MSKYEPLTRFLKSQSARELPMTFREVEQVLGFRLPDSARRHRPWWSNNISTHVNAAAWREAGWRTARVDLGAEKVTFIREQPGSRQATAAVFGEVSQDAHATPGVSESAPRTAPLYERLSPCARRLIDDWSELQRIDREAAIVSILDRVALDRRSQLLDAFPRVRMPEGHDSTDWIREDRDSR